MDTTVFSLFKKVANTGEATFENFDFDIMRLDIFLLAHLRGDAYFKSFVDVAKFGSTLSVGQSSVK